MTSWDSASRGSPSRGLLRSRVLFSAASAGLLVLHLLAACGKVGPPVAPEDIGIAAKLERERQQHPTSGTADEEEKPPSDGRPAEDVVLPPLRPIGIP